MATKENEKDKTEKQAPPAKDKGGAGIIVWAIMAVIIAIFSGSGFVLGRLFAKPASPENIEPAKEKVKAEETKAEKPSHGSSKTKEEKPSHGGSKAKEEGASSETPKINPTETWYYNELESVVVNPDEPGATRFVRVGLILEMSPELTSESAQDIIALKKPLLINWLNLYFKSLTLAEMKDDKDINRILSQVCDSFNEILFADDAPRIKKVLIREFNIQ